MCDLPPRALRPRKRAAFTSHTRNVIGTCRRDLVCIRSRNPGAAGPVVAGAAQLAGVLIRSRLPSGSRSSISHP
jgi:hypothetical protein